MQKNPMGSRTFSNENGNNKYNVKRNIYAILPWNLKLSVVKKLCLKPSEIMEKMHTIFKWIGKSTIKVVQNEAVVMPTNAFLHIFFVNQLNWTMDSIE